MKIWISFFFIAVASVLVFAETASISPSTPQSSTETSVPISSVTSMQDLNPVSASILIPYVYDPEQRRDPFKEFAPKINTVINKEATDEGSVMGPLAPLQRYSLDELNLAGIIWGVNEPKAMFLDPKGQTYIVGKDERIGHKNGYIAEIREGEVVIIETEKVKGKLISSAKVIKLNR